MCFCGVQMKDGYQGREGQLWLKVCSKYGPLPGDTMDEEWADAIKLGNSGQYSKAREAAKQAKQGTFKKKERRGLPQLQP
jgi:hypothetical protein